MKNIFHLGKGKVTTLHELFLEQLRDLYSAETQLIEALPKMAEASHARPLKKGFEDHLEQTKGHAERIELIFTELDAERTDRQDLPGDEGSHQGRPGDDQ